MSRRYTRGIQEVYRRYTGVYKRYTRGIQEVYGRYTEGIQGYTRVYGGHPRLLKGRFEQEVNGRFEQEVNGRYTEGIREVYKRYTGVFKGPSAHP